MEYSTSVAVIWRPYDDEKFVEGQLQRANIDFFNVSILINFAGHQLH